MMTDFGRGMAPSPFNRRLHLESKGYVYVFTTESEDVNEVRTAAYAGLCI